MLIVLALGVVKGPGMGEPANTNHPFLHGDTKLSLDSVGKTAFRAVSILFVILGVIFFFFGDAADWLWFESAGNLTSLTARLFASPMIGLGVASWIISNSAFWRQVRVPAVGMCTFGVSGILTLILEFAGVQPPTAFGYIPVAAPFILLVLGVYLLLPARGK